MPIVVANMTAIAGRRMAETVARRGGLVVLPQDVPLADRGRGRRLGEEPRPGLRDRRSRLGPNDTVARRAQPDAQARARRGRRGRRRQARSASSPRPTAPGSTATPRSATCSPPTCSPSTPTTSRADGGLRRAFDALHEARRRFAPVVRDGLLVGVLTRTGALRSTIYQPALDGRGRLRVAAAVGINGDVAGKAEGAARGRGRHPRRRHRPRSPGEDARGPAARPRGRRRRGGPRGGAPCRSSPATSSPPPAPAT